MEKITTINEESVENGKTTLDLGGREPMTSASVCKDCISLTFTCIPCMDVMAQNRRQVDHMVTIAGFCSNVVVKGVMKAVGFIFKAIMDHVSGILPIMAVVFPATMHLFFNCFSIFVPLIVRKWSYFWTLVSAIILTCLSFLCMSFLPDDNPDLVAKLLVLYGGLIGIGCALHFHTGVQMLNLLVHASKNAFANGLSLAGNTIGAMFVFGLMGYSFKELHYADSLFYLSIGMAILLGSFTLLYLVPQRYISEYADEEVSSATKTSETYMQELWDAKMFANPVYYLLCISQCCNAIGFLNLTTFLNVGLHGNMGYSDTHIAFVLMGMQTADLVGRIGFTAIADRLHRRNRFVRHIIYIVGVIGTGVCMTVFQYARTDAQVVTLVTLMGLFSSCFIGLWNSVIKSETQTHKEFRVIYSHSLFVTGIAQFIATFVTLMYTQEESGKQDYGQLMALFGCILITASFPIFCILFLKLEQTEEEEDQRELSGNNAPNGGGEITPIDEEGRRSESNQEINLSKMEEDAHNVTVVI